MYDLLIEDESNNHRCWVCCFATFEDCTAAACGNISMDSINTAEWDLLQIQATITVL